RLGGVHRRRPRIRDARGPLRRRDPRRMTDLDPVVLSWSGGKDSALALWAMREELGIEPAALLTTFTENYERVSMHGVRRELLRAQAQAVGVPLLEVGIPAGATNDLYEERFAAALN